MPSTSTNAVNPPKKATNVSLSAQLLVDAKALQINVSQAAEAGVARAVAEKRAERWVKDNARLLHAGTTTSRRTVCRSTSTGVSDGTFHRVSEPRRRRLPA